MDIGTIYSAVMLITIALTGGFAGWSLAWWRMEAKENTDK